MTCIIFETPGLIDIRAFTTMGLSAKPNSRNPIGYFGTGLKYAIAVLVRLGAEPVVWIGKDKYTFFKKKTEFRGKGFDLLRMRCEKFHWTKPRVTDLPFTTEFGRNWKPWMAYRELESNTRDENGKTWRMEFQPDWMENNVEERSFIVVELPEFIEAYDNHDEVFLPNAQREGSGVQVIDSPGKFLYWRGLKVYELDKESEVTYNILDHMDLTEDRTLAAEYYARVVISRWLTGKAEAPMVERLLTAKDDSWERSLDFTSSYDEPSPAFRSVVHQHPRNMNVSAMKYYAKYDERIVAETFDPFEAHPLPWKLVDDMIEDANGNNLFTAPYRFEGRWDLLAEAMLKKINNAAPVEEATLEPADDQSEEAQQAYADSEEEQ